MKKQYEYYSFIDEKGKLNLTQMLEDETITNNIAIPPINKTDLSFTRERINSETFDNEEEAYNFIQSEYEADKHSHYRFFSLEGYELINDNHVLKLYYRIHISNS